MQYSVNVLIICYGLIVIERSLSKLAVRISVSYHQYRLTELVVVTEDVIVVRSSISIKPISFLSYPFISFIFVTPNISI